MIPLLLPALSAAVVAAADTTRYLVINHGRPAGEMLVIRTGQHLDVRYHHVDRNRGPRLASIYHVTSAGAVRAGDVRPLLASGEPGAPTFSYSVSGDSVTWTSAAPSPGGGRSETRSFPGAIFRLPGATLYDDVLAARELLRRPERSAMVLPAGDVRLEVVADTTLRLSSGRVRARLVMLSNSRGPVPRGLWLDDRNELLATDANWFITVRPDVVPALPGLRAIELAWRERQAAEAARRLAPPAEAGPVAITGGDLFDSEAGVIRRRMTILVQGERIVAVGPADSVPVPAGARVVEATGRLVLPGLYDMHGHVQTGSQQGSALWQLAAGVTTLRDMAADMDVAVSQRDRAERQAIISPRLILGGFIEGPGRWAGPSEVIVRTEDEARAWVVRYASLGYRQIKLYNLVHPDLVPAIAAEARARGLRLSGHVPRGLSVPAAIALGFDEINHAAFLFSTFFQDSLYTPTMRAYSAVAANVAPGFDVNGPLLASLIELFLERGTVIDGTFEIFSRGGGGVIGQGQTTSPVNEVAAAYGRLARRLHEAGVIMVAGTDNGGPFALNGELETYERAGIPAAAVLQMATIVPARVMGEAAAYGSIAPGKVADLVLVRGNPLERLADLRNVEQVMRAGRMYDSNALFAATGVVRRQAAASGGP